METSEKKGTPPYVAYRTLKNFLEKFDNGVPGRIERGLMGTMSGAVQSQLTSALKYLGLMSEHSVPTDALRKLVAADGDDKTGLMREMITAHYPFIFAKDFDFKTATGSMVRERFEEHTGATGETVNRCISFLKDAAQDSGIAVSPFLSHKKASSSSPTKRKQPKAKSGKSIPYMTGVAEEIDGTEERDGDRQRPKAPAEESLLLWGLFQRLPKPGSAWSKSDREQWTTTLLNVLTMEYKEQ